MLYKCSFLIGKNQFEIPINGYDSGIRSTLTTILGHGKNIDVYDETFNRAVIGSATNITYSSEAFSNQTYSSSDLKTDYLRLDSNIIFKNNESLIGIFKIENISKETYKVSKIGSFNDKKFILEVRNETSNGLVVFNSLNKKAPFEMKSKEDYLILTTYDNIIIKHGNDYYIIIYDVNNSLFGTITENNLINSSDPYRELNYYLEYPSSRGRVPLINDCLLEAVYLGRDPDSLNSEDKNTHKIAYVYGGMLYKNNSVSLTPQENTIKYSDLQLIDEDVDYTMLIDYKHLCDGKAILNSTQSEWLKI